MTGDETLSRLSTLFSRDHAKLTGLLDDVVYLCGKGSYQPAAKVFGEFRLMQEHHLQREEQLLAHLSRSAIASPDVVQRLSADHFQLKELMESTWAAICEGNWSHFTGSAQQLVEAVCAHEHDEQQVLLPVLRHHITDETNLSRVVRSLTER